MCHRSFLRYGLIMFLAMALLLCCDKEHDKVAFTNPYDPDNPETHGDPYNLQVNARADGVQLKWDKVANVSEIIVYRSTSPDSGFERIGTSTSGEYVDTDTQTGMTYYYQVRAYARGVEALGSRLTNASTVRINTPPTCAIVGHELDKDTLLVQWEGSDADGSVKSYIIKLDDGEWTDVGTQTEFRKEDLAEGVHRFYVKSQDNLGAEESEAQVLEFTVDTLPPSDAGITIKEGNTTNSRSVTLSLSASGAAEMRISNSSSFSGSSWETYSSTKSWTLSSGDGTKTVYAQFRDAAGNESSVVSDTIVLDASAPSGSISINGGASYTTNRALTLSLSASGATEMRISNSSSFSGSSWETYSSSKSWTLSSGDGTKRVYAQFRDAAGNESSTVSDTIALDTSAPVSDDMVLIPAGEFSMGDAFSEGDSDERPVHTVYLDAFYMDKYEVTNAQYAAFLNQCGKNTDASGYKLLNIDSSYCQIEKVGGSYRAKSGYDDHPVIEVSWYGAKAYAEFYGKRLPTEAEWEKAARGGLAGKRYPWGDEITHDDANYVGTGGVDVWSGTSPVGSFAPNGYSLYDMAGNVWDWCADWYSSSYYASSPRSNPQGPGSGTYRVLRGGSWFTLPDFLRVASRYSTFPTNSGILVGFRCVSQD